jgi:hypothetical protein
MNIGDCRQMVVQWPQIRQVLSHNLGISMSYPRKLQKHMTALNKMSSLYLLEQLIPKQQVVEGKCQRKLNMKTNITAVFKTLPEHTKDL